MTSVATGSDWRGSIAENKLADARTLMAPVAYQPHLPAEMRDMAAKIMAALSQGDAKAALSLMANPKAAAENPGKKPQ